MLISQRTPKHGLSSPLLLLLPPLPKRSILRRLSFMLLVWSANINVLLLVTCRFVLALALTFEFLKNTAILEYMILSSVSSVHQVWLFQTKNRPPRFRTAVMTLRVTSILASREGATLCSTCFDSTRPRNMTFPGWHIVDWLGRKTTSLSLGHSTIDSNSFLSL